MDSLKILDTSDVTTPELFARYCQQRLGVPGSAVKDLNILKKFVKEFFAQYPRADYQTLCRLVGWCAARKKRPSHAYKVVQLYRYAWSDGFLPELDPTGKDEVLEGKIGMALKVESDPTWRDRLEHSMGITARQSVYDGWAKTRRPVILLEVISGGRTSVVS